MELITPGLGLIFWMTFAFVILLVLLRTFAWKPILKALKERETSISEALAAADKAKADMEHLKFSNEQLLMDAKNERDALLNEARKVREKLIEEARDKAREEGDRIIAAARDSIHNEKMAAMTELKNQLGELSLEVARKILQRELSDQQKQEAYIRGLLEETKLN